MRGTLLNTATVAVGASLGLLVGSSIPPQYQQTAMAGLGLVVVGIGVKLFLQSKNVLYIAGAIALGGILGTALGIDLGLHDLTEWVRGQVGGGTHFNQGLITCSILFCVGPLTLLGCIKDGLEGDIELLSVKSTMDGFGAFFFATALGRDGGFGVLLSALVVLVYQGLLTLLARPLRPLASDTDLFAEVSGSGGVMLMAIGLGLLEIRSLPVANYLPALVLAPLFVWLGRRFGRRKALGTATAGVPEGLDLLE
jgi:uncharacterized membrane protein YqgA involved in biofilm formation